MESLGKHIQALETKHEQFTELIMGDGELHGFERKPFLVCNPFHVGACHRRCLDAETC